MSAIEPVQSWDSKHARAAYDVLRDANPHLPPGDYVASRAGIAINMGDNEMPTVRLEVFITIPEQWRVSGL